MVSVQCQRSMPTAPETSTALLTTRGFPGGIAGKESACQRRRSKRGGFDPWVRKILWRRKRQPTPVVLPEEPHGQRSLAGYSPWGHKELDMTERGMHAWKHQHCTLAVGLTQVSSFSHSCPVDIFAHLQFIFIKVFQQNARIKSKCEDGHTQVWTEKMLLREAAEAF